MYGIVGDLYWGIFFEESSQEKTNQGPVHTYPYYIFENGEFLRFQKKSARTHRQEHAQLPVNEPVGIYIIHKVPTMCTCVWTEGQTESKKTLC